MRNKSDHSQGSEREREREREKQVLYDEAEAYLLVIAIPPDGTLAIDLALPIQRQVVDAMDGQEVGLFSRPNVVWCYNIAVQLQITSSAAVLLVCCLQNIWMQAWADQSMAGMPWHTLWTRPIC
jgi:hypothetical protein